MTALQKAQAVLAGNGPLIALVPAKDIRPPGNWQSLPAPHIIHFPAAGLPERTYEGLTAFRRYLSYQVEIYAETYSQADTIYRAVIAALDGKHGQFEFHLAPGSPYRGRDDKKNLEFLTADFMAAGQES